VTKRKEKRNYNILTLKTMCMKKGARASIFQSKYKNNLLNQLVAGKKKRKKKDL